MAGFSLFSLSFRVSTTWTSKCIHIDLVKLSLYESLQPGQANWCMFSLLKLKSFRLRSLTGELSPSRWSRVCLYILSSPGRDMKSQKSQDRFCQVTSNVKCGYTVVPAGCCPVEMRTWLLWKKDNLRPLHVPLHPHLVREVSDEHPYHPQASNSPPDPKKGKFVYLISLQSMRYLIVPSSGCFVNLRIWNRT